jgi:ADP-ribose pyrophosphatase
MVGSNGDGIRLIGSEVLSDAWGVVRRNVIELRRRDGSWQRQVRETYDSGDGAAVLLYNRQRRTVILTRQFRFPVHAHGEAGLLIEAPAGKLDGDDPASCARREAEEETGFHIADPVLVNECFSSPGSTTEKLSLFVAEYDEGSRISAGGGLSHEGEDIEVLEIGFEEAMAMLASGAIADAKTVILLQHAALSGLFDRSQSGVQPASGS